MKKTYLSKLFAALATRFRTKLIFDVFASARLRMTMFYVLLGMVMLAASGWLTYNRTIQIFNLFTERLSAAISETATGTVAFPPNAPQPGQEAQADLLTRQANSQIITFTVQDEVIEMIYANSLWMMLVILVCSYVLAGMTLKPIERVLENKKRFIANASHELRTPLSVIKTSSETALLGEENASKEELVAALKSNLEEVDRMANILQFLFVFSDFEQKTKPTTMSPVDLFEVLQGSLRAVEIRARSRKIDIKVWKDEKVFVQGNSVALDEVFTNLLRNSIRHTPEGGSIRVMLESNLQDGTAIIKVKDSGVGIASHDLPHVFEPFYRGRKVGPENKKNAGLGLAIVKEIVAMHHGTISIQSKLGEGTTVEIILPAATGPAA